MNNKSRPIIFSAPMIRALLDGRKTQTRRPMKVKDIFGKDFSTYGKDGIDALIRHHCPYGRVGDLLWVRETFVLENTRAYHGDHEIPTDGRPIQNHDDAHCGEWCLIPHYRATEPEPHIVPYDLPESAHDGDDRTRWKPCIFMPRWASRLTLKITDIRVERVQDISDPDAMAEGAFHTDYGMHCFHAGKVRDASLCQGSDSSHHRKNGWSMSETTSHKECLSMAKFAFGNTWNKLYNDENKPQFAWDKNPWVWVVEFEVIEKNVLEVADEH